MNNGYIYIYIGSGKNTRGTQIFFTLNEHSTHLGKEAWEVPFGKVIYGDDTLKSINTEYGDQVSQQKIWREGYTYLRREYPNLSYIEYCKTINENEMMYYLKSVKKQGIKLKEKQPKEESNKLLDDDDVEHDLQKQLYGDDNQQINNNNKYSFIFVAEIVVVIGCIGAIVFVVTKLLRKTPHKNN